MNLNIDQIKLTRKVLQNTLVEWEAWGPDEDISYTIRDLQETVNLLYEMATEIIIMTAEDLGLRDKLARSIGKERSDRFFDGRIDNDADALWCYIIREATNEHL